MTSLVNVAPSNLYGDILTCTNNGQGLQNFQTNLQDGLGNNSPILIASNSVNFDRGLGQFQIDAVALTSNVVDINSMCQPNPIALGNSYFKVPTGTQAQRPVGPQSGYFRFNTDISDLEFYTGATWQSISAGSTISSVSGTVGQIAVANPTTTPVISLVPDLTGIRTITASAFLTLNASIIELTSVGSVQVRGTSFQLHNACTAYFFNNDDTFSVQISGLLANEDATYYLPASKPIVSNQALTCDLFNAMSWKSVQLMTPVNVVGSLSLLVNERNVINSVGPILLQLPSNASVGDIIEICGNTGGWTITQNAGQTIHWLNQNTTTGIAGTLASNTVKDCVKLVCVVANTDFIVFSHEGNLIVT